MRAALDICRHRMADLGYLTQASKTGPVEGIKLTTKGRPVDQKHHRERDGRRKTKEFDRLYEKWLVQPDPPEGNADQA